jgi:uncharacterized SAM-binding protein YcdF (DUF218 family)
VLWFLAQPSTLIIGAVVAAAILCTTSWCRFGRRMLLVAVPVLLIGGISPVGDLLIAPLENRFRRADLSQGNITGIIVLGGSEDGRAGPSRELAGLNEAAERYTEAAALARRLPNARLVFSGGSAALFTDEPPEADTASRLFTALGIDKDRITLESKSRDTFENATFTARMIKPVAGERWLLVTSAWHMPRAIGCCVGPGCRSRRGRSTTVPVRASSRCGCIRRSPRAGGASTSSRASISASSPTTWQAARTRCFQHRSTENKAGWASACYCFAWAG